MKVIETVRQKKIKVFNSCKYSVSFLSHMSITAFPPAKSTLFVISVPALHCWSEQSAWKVNLA